MSKSISSVQSADRNLYLRNGVYYGVVVVNGKQHWKSLRTKDLRIAKKRLKEVLGIYRAPEYEHKSQYTIPLVKELCEVVLERMKTGGRKNGAPYSPRSIQRSKDHLDKVATSFLGMLKVSSVRRKHLIDYLDAVANESSGRNANMRLGELRKVFKQAILQDLIYEDPTKSLETYAHESKDVYVPTIQEIQTILGDLRTKLLVGKRYNFEVMEDRRLAADLIEVIIHSGLRVSEASQLHAHQIDFKLNQIILTRKGGKECTLEMFPGLQKLLTKMIKRQLYEGYLFPQCEKTEYYYPRKALASACNRTGIQKFGFHGLRHRFASTAVESGIDFGTIAEWLGHSDGGLLVGRVYGKHRSREHLQAQASKLHIET